MTKQYSWNTSKDAEFWDYGIFDSIEECIEDSKNYDVIGFIYVAEVYPYEISVDAYSVLEDLEQTASDECGEAADSWCPSYDIDKSEIDHLSVKLTNIIRSWLKQQGYLPNFFNIGNIIKIDLKQKNKIIY